MENTKSVKGWRKTAQGNGDNFDFIINGVANGPVVEPAESQPTFEEWS